MLARPSVTEIIDQKVLGQKDMFAPVLSGVPGQMTRCPCGFVAYDSRSIMINQSPCPSTEM